MVIRNTNTSDNNNNNDNGSDYDCDCDRYPTEHSPCHNEEPLDESMRKFHPFSSQLATTPSCAPAYHTSHSVHLDPGKAVKTAEHRTEKSGKRPVTNDYHMTRQDPVLSPQRHFPSQAPQSGVYAPDPREEDELPTWAELAERAWLHHSKGRTNCSGPSMGREVLDDVHHSCRNMGRQVPDQEHDTDEIMPAPNHPSNLHIPFHRLPALVRVDGDCFPHLFAVPPEFRRKYTLSANSSRGGYGKGWWAICKGYEISVFCDSWAYIQALTGPVNGFQKKAATWRQAVAYYNHYEQKSNTY
ncbi:hypothetical protein BDN71DRAFT_1428916 [Pleurotus eryngii]|uniref:Uncharacterized protein n=1 Tax=Pleurotus eryngii TaxID=5323 RepID=A0A9P6A192_PLEER|nr:hypothetical protein BDN71DRAFT_1428916 [Pleurotus eryngii]